MDLAAIKQLAEDLNYEGQDLRNFVDKHTIVWRWTK